MNTSSAHTKCPAPGGDTLLDLADVSVNFGGVKALSRVSFSVSPGEIVGLIGPNGAGKTTIFNVVTGVYKASSGSVAFRGERLTGQRPHQILARGVARTFQNIRLFPNMTALENVMIGRHSRAKAGIAGAVLRLPSQRREEAAIAERSREALEFMNLGQTAETLAKNLPYGHQRRLEISRALATDPSLILLDEPAAGLNPAETAALMLDIQRIVEGGVSVLLVEHDMKFVMGCCARIVVLDHGVKIAEGRPEEVQRNPKVIEAYLGEPTEGSQLELKPEAAEA